MTNIQVIQIQINLSYGEYVSGINYLQKLDTSQHNN